jgi:hypothetical protein
VVRACSCDNITISPALLAELEASTAPLERKLSPDMRSSPDADLRGKMDAAAFAALHGADQMAVDKLKQGGWRAAGVGGSSCGGRAGQGCVCVFVCVCFLGGGSLWGEGRAGQGKAGVATSCCGGAAGHALPPAPAGIEGFATDQKKLEAQLAGLAGLA